ncbi:hypothetical protein BZG01_00035 [Labilibaculum manganireducens]|uniref:AAA+ ATPase domain-containing protein n=1 Tax=Labilibaculum manganireducens TaxID=1940525 RepID=A0A2N3IGE6_9BACT|nr:hypothetical protein [Labilibaculum manganireducens]PKQ69361.1 hypothetical protein BZG01_00035 [Labilibaculum manganireducens]
MSTALKERKRAVSVSEIYTKKFNVLPFDGAWLDSFGKPELTGTWLVWGPSGNGKTRFVLQLCKYLATLGRKVAYNSLEEGASLSMRNAFMDVGMEEVKRRIVLLDAEPIDQLIERLQKRKSPDVVAIDSVQYTGMNYKDYKRLRAMFPNKMFILISHADGKNPAGRVAGSIKYDAFVKVRIEGYKAFPLSRYGGGKPYTIWAEGAEDYYMD